MNITLNLFRLMFLFIGAINVPAFQKLATGAQPHNQDPRLFEHGTMPCSQVVQPFVFLQLTLELWEQTNPEYDPYPVFFGLLHLVRKGCSEQMQRCVYVRGKSCGLQKG